jgi:hypothetical protein
MWRKFYSIGEIMEKLKGVLIAITLWTGLIMMGDASAETITMDVDKWNGTSGTYICKDVKTCYMLYLNAEARGSIYYCNSVVIKRDGRVIWYKNLYR